MHLQRFNAFKAGRWKCIFRYMGGRIMACDLAREQLNEQRTMHTLNAEHTQSPIAPLLIHNIKVRVEQRS